MERWRSNLHSGAKLAIELTRSGAKLAISDVDTEGLAATEEPLAAGGAPVKADPLDVTEREAFQVYADARNATAAEGLDKDKVAKTFDKSSPPRHRRRRRADHPRRRPQEQGARAGRQ